MQKTILIIVLAMLCFFFKVNSQTITPLKIGDKIPEAVWNMPLKVINHPTGKQIITLNDYKGKLIILDFWATWCTACIAGMPKVHLLAQQYNGSMVTIPITYEPKNKVLPFINQNKNLAPLNMLSVVSESQLKGYFPHQLIPHYVWIGQDQRIKMITTSEYVTEENIKRILNNIDVQGQIKKDINPKLPLFLSEDFPKNNQVMYYSILSRGAYSGLPTGSQMRRKGGTIYGRALTNSRLLLIYESAISPIFETLHDSYNSKRLLLDVSDRSKINGLKNIEGGTDTLNSYNYDIIVPENKADSLYHFMLRDLNNYTSYYGRIQKRKVKCLVLLKTGGLPEIKTKGGVQVNTLFNQVPARLINSPLSYFIIRVNDLKEIPYPVIDETQILDHVDLVFPSKIHDLNDLQKALQSIGLKLEEAYRELNTFVLSDKPSPDSQSLRNK